MLCKLTQNITQDCSLSNGFEPFVYVYNISDINSFVFGDDNRYNDTGKIDTIVTSEPFLKIDAAEVLFNEEIDEETGKYIQTLTLNMNYSTDLEIILNNARNSRYLVCFKRQGNDDFMSIGYKSGSSLSFAVEDGGNYVITFTNESEYPSLVVDSTNFDLENKYFTPVFKPLYNIFTCELVDGQKTGYKIASYVVKVNSAGQALDLNNQLCSVTGKKQDAYRYVEVVSAGDYRIIDTYDSTAMFEGIPVKVFSYTDCPIEASGTITLDKQVIWLNTDTSTASLTITTDNKWEIEDLSPILNVSQQNGDGNATISVMRTSTGGDVSLKVRNMATYEVVECVVHINLIKLNKTTYTFSNTTRQALIPVVVEGGNADYTIAVNAPYLETIKEPINQRINLIFMRETSDGKARTWTMTLTHSDDPNEIRRIVINKLGDDANPQWTLVREYCENINS